MSEHDPTEPINSSPVLPPDDDLDDIQPRSRPRSIRRRLEEQVVEEAPPPPRSSRVRSQPIQQSAPTRRVREPVPIAWEPEPMSGPWRAKPFVVGGALAMWLVALALLLAEPTPIAGISPRVLLPIVWAAAAALTFVPLQFRLALPGIGWQGVLGWSLLGYLLAFVPAPRGWLLDLPDLPVYLLLLFAIFYAISAAVVPITYLLGQRFYKLRIHRLDVGRARRQAYEVGLLIVVALAMAALRTLTPITFGLLTLVVILTEALLLSQVQPEG
jgi:hypothetical protein